MTIRGSIVRSTGSPTSTGSTGSTGRRLAFSLAAVFGVLIVLEGGLNWARALGVLLGDAPTMEEARHTEYDADLGWQHLAAFSNPSFYGSGRGLTTNRQRLRSSSGDYDAAIPPDRYRVVTLGDSFTMGFGVDDDDTYPAQLEALVVGTQVINMGMGGYGIGQDYLWYLRDGVRFATDLLVFAFISHDFDRIGAGHFLGYPKPVVALESGELVATRSPVPRERNRLALQMRTDHFARKLAITSLLRRLFQRAQSDEMDEPPARVEDFADVAEAIFSDLARRSSERGQDFALLVLPTLAPQPEGRSEWLRAFSVRTGIALIDLSSHFADLPHAEHEAMFIPADGHLSVHGNRVVAATTASELAARFPEFPR